MSRKNTLAERVEQNRYLPVIYAEANGEMADKSAIKIKLEYNRDYSGKFVYEVAVDTQSLLRTIGSRLYFTDATERFRFFPTEHSAMKKAAKEFVNTCNHFNVKIEIKNTCPEDLRELIEYYSNYTYAT